VIADPQTKLRLQRNLAYAVGLATFRPVDMLHAMAGANGIMKPIRWSAILPRTGTRSPAISAFSSTRRPPLGFPCLGGEVNNADALIGNCGRPRFPQSSVPRASAAGTENTLAGGTA